MPRVGCRGPRLGQGGAEREQRRWPALPVGGPCVCTLDVWTPVPGSRFPMIPSTLPSSSSCVTMVLRPLGMRLRRGRLGWAGFRNEPGDSDAGASTAAFLPRGGPKPSGCFVLPGLFLALPDPSAPVQRVPPGRPLHRQTGWCCLFGPDPTSPVWWLSWRRRPPLPLSPRHGRGPPAHLPWAALSGGGVEPWALGQPGWMPWWCLHPHRAPEQRVRAAWHL